MISRIPRSGIGGGIADSATFQITDIGETENDIGKAQDSERNTKLTAKESITNKRKLCVYLHLMEYSEYLLLLLLLLQQIYFLTRPV